VGNDRNEIYSKLYTPNVAEYGANVPQKGISGFVSRRDACGPSNKIIE